MPTTKGKPLDTSPVMLPPSQISKPQRVLACVLCQQRKVKCDRKYPCANCVKSRAQCVLATQVSRRRRRRLPGRELLERIRKYEDLLCQNNIKFEPLHRDSGGEMESPNVEGGYSSYNEQPKTAEAAWSSPSTTTNSERVYEAKYVLSKKLFMMTNCLRNIWHAMSQEVQLYLM